MELLRNICPENSLTASRGYNTEKAPQALLSGAIPLYWGDTPLDPEVFNPSRLLVYMDNDNSSVLAVVSALERERQVAVDLGDLSWFGEIEWSEAAGRWVSAARPTGVGSATLRWFEQPVLSPTADLWMKTWCANVGTLVAQQWALLHGG